MIELPDPAAALQQAAAEAVSARPSDLPPDRPRGRRNSAPGAKAPAKPAAPPRPPPGGTPAKLMPGCPVTPLGTEGPNYHYLDPLGQLRTLKGRDHGTKDILSLFAPSTGWLWESYPRVNSDGIRTGWRAEIAGEALMNACARAGVWDVRERLRGRGAWTDADGGLVLHAGDAVLYGGAWQATGSHGEHVYPAAPPVPRPVTGVASAESMRGLLHTLETWRWRRPLLDSLLMLGWLGCARVGGALRWRPLIWVSGDKGTGKSTLHELVGGLMGGALLRTSDASEAGIRQTLGSQTLPVAIDEAEADEDNRRLQALLKLARQASSGGVVVRGGADHQATEFIARSCFLMSSILVPPLLPQDRSRFALLELRRLDAGAAPPAWRPHELAALGAALTRRMVDGWARWAETMEGYRAALAEMGHSARAADQYGALLGAADLLLYDRLELALVPDWLAELGLREVETGDDTSDADACLTHLMTTSVMLDGGGRPQTVAYWVRRAWEELDSLEPGTRVAERALSIIGLRVQPGAQKGEGWLAVSVAHQGLARLYHGTQWQARSGAQGVWRQSLSRLPGAEASSRVVRIGGRPAKAVRLALDAAIAMSPDDTGRGEQP